MFFTWQKMAMDSALLMMESQVVICARLGQIATGRGTPAETALMVTEKMQAAFEAATTIAMGGSAHKVIRGYRRRVNANRRRLR